MQLSILFVVVLPLNPNGPTVAAHLVLHYAARLIVAPARKEKERRQISERTRAAVAACKEPGTKLGNSGTRKMLHRQGQAFYSAEEFLQSLTLSARHDV